MLSNERFLDVIKDSFNTYLSVGTSRSTAKLKTLHGHIAKDLAQMLGEDYSVISQGYGSDKEIGIDGRYYPKKVDITICRRGKAVAGYAIKFAMRNYSQNSNNYFENMLGETANLRSNNIPYFQVFIIFDKVPYYKKGGELARYDRINIHNLDKYLKLSNDNPDILRHTPDKTLLIIVKLKEKYPDYKFSDDREYADYYLSVIDDDDLISYSNMVNDEFGDAVILNDYADFISRTVYMIKGRQKN